ncbi:MAG: RdgB/HAM1 family non-canonical purine NTP pyrophosphatase [Pseudomonadota bacterium]
MVRKLGPGKLVIASHNAGKVREIGDLVRPYEIEAVSAAALNLAEPEETESTFVGNAALKARAAAHDSGLPALADDSGLCVSALDGAPGIYSARWAGEPRDFGVAMDKVRGALDELDTEDFRAHFVCALCLAWPDGHEETFEGAVHGNLQFPPRGHLGFGYDPIFVPVGDTRTFSEIEPEEKHRISHRARAFKRLVEACLA